MDDDLFGIEAIRDPYTYFAALRASHPVYWNARFQLWIVTGYHDVVRLVRDHEHFSSVVIARESGPPYPPVDPGDLPLVDEVRAFRALQLVEQDRPRHAAMRNVVKDLFTPTAIEAWRPFIREAVNRILDGVLPRGHMDVATDLAAPLPVTVIAAMMGITADDHERLRDVADKLLYINRGETYRLRPLVDGIRGMLALVEPHAARRRAATRGSDLISVLCQGEEDGAYDRAEVLANAALLLFAGHETTMNLICNGLVALLEHPDQWALLRQDIDGRVRRATEECLRYDPPVKSTQRVTTADVSLSGITIPAGQRIRWIMASANRDPAVFARPDEFDISRHPNPHVSFGGGIHHCLGAALARVEGQEVFRALATRVPDITLQGRERSYQPSIQFRSLTSLPATWSSWS